jgi:Ca-activated chloride channel homolog
MKYIFLLCCVLLSLTVTAQSEKKFIREGNKRYEDGKYGDAENSYRKATNIKANSFAAAYNTANSLYKQGKYADAAAMYDSLTRWKSTPAMQAKLYHNMGNSFLQAKKLNEAISSYKNSLKLNPKDQDTKYNLSYAYQLLKKDQNKNKNDKNKDKNKDNKDNKDKKDQNKDQNKDNKDKKDNKDQQKQPQNQDQKNQDKKGGQQQISPEAAQQMLDAIQNDEKNLQKKLEEQKKQGQKVPVSKNW